MTAEQGHFRCYVEKRFRQDVLDLIGQANDIIADYTARGYVLTLRQLYYQMVARGLMENSQSSYNRLGSAINDGRLAGLVSWTSIEDRTRNLKGLRHHRTPADAVREARAEFRLDLWRDQPFRPEIWIEKEALEGVVAKIANELRVDFFACRGYNSQSEQWRAGKRFARYVSKGQRPIVFHLGDHDPSGLDMTRDNRERLELFAGVPVQVVRLALNMPQIEELRPPPNPAKATDSRFEDYRREWGEESWELDALPPEYMERLIRDAVERLRDGQKWDRALELEAEGLERLDEVIEDMDGADGEEEPPE